MVEYDNSKSRPQAHSDYIKNVVEDGKLAKATLQGLKTNKKF